MADSGSVGFSFQGDVGNAASLVYSASGHLLKTLSDGGVDFYAVGACVQLGATLSITAAQEVAVQRLVSSRTGRQSYIAKALYLGWGHSDVAMELTRTRGGTAALMLIGVLATGGSAFDAATALQELFRLHGCSAGILPSIDRLLTMIRYLSPFVQDSMFGEIVAQIDCAISKRMSRHGKVTVGERSAWNARGEPQTWIKAVKQLAFTSSRGEHVYMLVGQRGSWIAACAQFMFGMAVQVQYHDEVVWAAAGEQGIVTIQLAYSKVSCQSVSSRSATFCISAPSNLHPRPLSTVHPLKQALSSVLGMDNRMTGIPQQVVFKIITQEVSKIFTILSGTNLSRRHSTHVQLPRCWENMESVLEHMGIPPAEILSAKMDLHFTKESFGPRRRDLLNSIDAATLTEACNTIERHHESNIHNMDSNDGYDSTCLCAYASRVIRAAVALAVALSLCTYAPIDIFIKSSAITHCEFSTWSKYINSFIDETYETVNRFTSHKSLMEYLALALVEDDEARDVISAVLGDKEIVAISAGNVSIYHKILMDDQCFTEHLQFIQISPGRITFEKNIRTIVYASNVFQHSEGLHNIFSTGSPSVGGHNRAWRVAPSTSTSLHYVPGEMAVCVEVTLASDAIDVVFYLTSKGRQVKIPQSYWTGMQKLVECRVVRILCNHASKTTLKAGSSDQPVSISSFLGPRLVPVDPTAMIIYPLYGHGVEALFQMQDLDPSSTCLSMNSCITCTILEVRQNKQRRDEERRAEERRTEARQDAKRLCEEERDQIWREGIYAPSWKRIPLDDSDKQLSVIAL